MSAVDQLDRRLAGVTLLPVREVAKLLAISPRTVWRLSALAEAGQGDFPRPVRVAEKTVRWPLARLEEYLAKLTAQGQR